MLDIKEGAEDAEVARFLLRMPAGLHAELAAWARDDERSLNSQLVYLLRRAVREWRQAG